jgi:hypothetical protein
MRSGRRVEIWTHGTIGYSCDGRRDNADAEMPSNEYPVEIMRGRKVRVSYGKSKGKYRTIYLCPRCFARGEDSWPGVLKAEE